jgi:hypothetical protein
MIKNKKLISVIMVGFLLFLSSSKNIAITSDKRTDFLKINLTDQILELENTKVTITKLVPLFDVNLQKNYTLAIFENKGYAIIANQSLTLSEYAVDDTPVPYAKILNRNVSLIYGGPDNYVYSSDKKTFYDASTLEVIKYTVSTEQKTMNQILLAADPKNPTIDDLEQQIEILKWTGIHESLFLRYNYGMWVNNPENYPIGNGICGPISVAIMMSFYQDNYNPDYIPLSVRTPGSAHPGNLIYLLEHHIGGSYTGTIAPMIYFGLQQFLDSYHITFYHPKMTMLGTWDIVKKNVDKRRPIAVGLTNWAGSPDNYGNHWVTVYAYSVNSKNKGFYKAIDNHGNYQARINASWTIGAIWLESK